MYCFGMRTQSEIIEYIGRDRIAAAFGITGQAVSMQVKAGKFPAAWYDQLEHMAGRPLPRELFKFKGPDTKSASGGA